jgi:hypothetical protein
MPSPFAVGVDLKRQKTIRLQRLQHEAAEDERLAAATPAAYETPDGLAGLAVGSCRPPAPGSSASEWVDDADDFDEAEEARAKARIQREQTRRAFADKSRQQQQQQSGRSLLATSSASAGSPGSSPGGSRSRARQGLAIFVGAMDDALSDSPAQQRAPKKDRAADMFAAASAGADGDGAFFGGAAAMFGAAQRFMGDAMTDASSQQRVIDAMRRLPMQRMFSIWRNDILERRDRARRFKQANAEGVHKWQLFYKMRPYLLTWMTFAERQILMKKAVHMMRGSDRRGALYVLQEHAEGACPSPPVLASVRVCVRARVRACVHVAVHVVARVRFMLITLC